MCNTNSPVQRGHWNTMLWLFARSRESLVYSLPLLHSPSGRWQQHPWASNSKMNESGEAICQGLEEKKYWKTNKPKNHPPTQPTEKKAANNFLLICLHAPLGPQGGSEATVQPAELWHWLTSICPSVPCAASTLGEERALLGKTGHQASTGASARGFSYTLDPAFYFPVPLNFTIKIKAMIFPTLHR